MAPASSRQVRERRLSANVQQRGWGGGGGSFLTSRSMPRSLCRNIDGGNQKRPLLHARDAETRRPALFSEPLLFSSPAVEGVVLGAQLRHLHRRQVHRDGLRGQEGHRLRGQLLAWWRRGGGALPDCRLS